MAKKKEAHTRYFVLPDGKKYKITGEDGKYWICGKTQFRKLAERGTVIEEQEEGGD